jgi:hypothetical protein
MITLVQAIVNERSPENIRNFGDAFSEFITVKGKMEIASIRVKNVEMVI